MPRADTLSPGAVKLLQERQIAQVATVMADGTPQITPVWIDVEPDGSHVIVNTFEGSLKTKNTTQRQDVAVSVVDSQNPWRFAIVRGTVVERRTEGAEE